MFRHMTALGMQVTIRELRKAYGLTLSDLADRIQALGVDVHPDTLSNVEIGRKRASDQLRVAWAKALKANPLEVTQPGPDGLVGSSR